jgi:hypothetical protein
VKSFTDKASATAAGVLARAIKRGTVQINKANGRIQEERTYPRSADRGARRVSHGYRPVVPAVGMKPCNERVDEIARAIQRETLKFIASPRSWVSRWRLRCVSNQVSVLCVVGSSLTPTLLR